MFVFTLWHFRLALKSEIRYIFRISIELLNKNGYNSESIFCFIIDIKLFLLGKHLNAKSNECSDTTSVYSYFPEEMFVTHVSPIIFTFAA